MNDRLRVLQRQPRRISITLSYHVHEALLSRSEEEGRSVSNLCAFLLEDALRDTNRSLNLGQHTQQPISNLGQLQRGVQGNGHKIAPPMLRQPPQH
jgi:macrodomain Ter protein organizer (MatP/YcbG family)